MTNSRPRPVPEIFTTDTRPGADASVYCKGCGQPLAGQARHQEKRVAVTIMMCDDCQEKHGHALIPGSDAPSYCYRCGEADVLVIEKGYSPITHRLCPRCVPERLARYRASDFRTFYESRAV